MPGSNQRRTLAVCIRVTIIVSLTIAAVTAVSAMFLYVVFGQNTSENPTSVHELRDDRPVAINTQEVSGKRLIPENRSAMEYLPPNRRSMNGHPLSSIGIRTPLADGGIHDMLAGRNRYPNNHRYGSGDDGMSSPEKYDESGITSDAEAQQNINRQINHIDYSNLETDNWTTEKDGSTGYHDTLDLTYNMGAYSNTQTDNLAGMNEYHKDTGLELDPYYSTIHGPYYDKPSGSQPIKDHQPLNTDYKLPSKSYQPPTTNYQLPNMNYFRPTDMIYQPPSMNYNTQNTNYEPPKITVPQKPILESPQQKIETPIPNTSSVVDWKLIFILSLIKLGIVKLKSIVIIKILLFLVFSLKLLLITLFFKFLLLFKFFKAMILPFMSVPLLLTSLIFPILFSSLFSIPGRIIRFLFTPNNLSQPSNMIPSLPAMMPSIPSNTLPSRPGTMTPNIPGTGRPGSFVPFVPRPGSSERPAGINAPTNQPSTSTFARYLGYLQQNKNGTPSTKSDTLHLPYGWHFKSLKASYPVMDLFWKIIDTDKCMERIACQMAVTEEAGTIPTWINWAMRVVSKFIPNKKLESYFKTYDDINNAILTSPSMRTPDNWNSWCLENYNCKITNVTHDTDT